MKRSVKRMLFKLGVTVIVLVAVYMYYAMDKEGLKPLDDGRSEGQKIPAEGGTVGQRDSVGQKLADEGNVGLIPLLDLF